MGKYKGEAINDEEALQRFLISYRATPSLNKDRKSPAEIMFGRSIRSFFDIAQHRNKVNVTLSYDGNGHKKIREFHVGDYVYTCNYRPCRPKWIDGKIVARIGKVVYQVRVGDLVIILHISQLRPNRNNDGPPRKVELPWQYSM